MLRVLLESVVGWESIAIVTAVAVADLLIRLALLPRVLAMFEHVPTFNALQLPPDSKRIPLSTRTQDGLTLRGSLLPPEHGPAIGVIVFCHEYGGDHHSAAWYCAGLRQAGFAVVAFDFRNHGESESLEGYEPLHWLTDYEVTDVSAMLESVAQREELEGLPLGVFGISRGGGAALAGASQHPRPEAIACEGAFSTDCMMMTYARKWMTVFVPRWMAKLVPSWHVRLTLVLARWVSQRRRRCRYTVLERMLPRLQHRRVLFIADGADSYVDSKVTRALCRAALHPESSIWRAAHAKHNQGRRSDPVTYDARLVTFFRHMVDESRLNGSGARYSVNRAMARRS